VRRRPGSRPIMRIGAFIVCSSVAEAEMGGKG
jgi:hypothetical protein